MTRFRAHPFLRLTLTRNSLFSLAAIFFVLASFAKGSGLVEPANNDFSNANMLPSILPVTVSQDTSGANWEWLEPELAVYGYPENSTTLGNGEESITFESPKGTIWWKWTAPKTAWVRFELKDNVGTQLRVYRGTELRSLVNADPHPIYPDSAWPGGGSLAQRAVFTQAGETLSLQAWADGLRGGGIVDLTIREAEGRQGGLTSPEAPHLIPSSAGVSPWSEVVHFLGQQRRPSRTLGYGIEEWWQFTPESAGIYLFQGPRLSLWKMMSGKITPLTASKFQPGSGQLSLAAGEIIYCASGVHTALEELSISVRKLESIYYAGDPIINLPSVLPIDQWAGLQGYPPDTPSSFHAPQWRWVSPITGVVRIEEFIGLGVRVTKEGTNELISSPSYDGKQRFMVQSGVAYLFNRGAINAGGRIHLTALPAPTLTSSGLRDLGSSPYLSVTFDRSLNEIDGEWTCSQPGLYRLLGYTPMQWRVNDGAWTSTGYPAPLYQLAAGDKIQALLASNGMRGTISLFYLGYAPSNLVDLPGVDLAGELGDLILDSMVPTSRRTGRIGSWQWTASRDMTVVVRQPTAIFQYISTHPEIRASNLVISSDEYIPFEETPFYISPQGTGPGGVAEAYLYPVLFAEPHLAVFTAKAGHTYWITDNSEPAQSPLGALQEIELREISLVRPANDDFATRQEVVNFGLPYGMVASLSGLHQRSDFPDGLFLATREQGEPDWTGLVAPGTPRGNFGATPMTTWWSWSPPKSGRFRFVRYTDTGAPLGSVRVSLYKQPANGSTSLLSDLIPCGSWDLSITPGAYQAFEARTDERYAIQVTTGLDASHYQLEINDEGPPPIPEWAGSTLDNDWYEYATEETRGSPLDHPGTESWDYEADLSEASLESHEPFTHIDLPWPWNNGAEPAMLELLGSRWWRFQAQTSGWLTVDIDRTGPRIQARSAVYTGIPGVTPLSLIVPIENGNADTASPSGNCTFYAQSGQHYFIQIRGERGLVRWKLREAPSPAADAYEQAQDLTGPLPIKITATNIGGTESLGGIGTLTGDEAVGSVWWKWTCTEAGFHSISIKSDFNNGLAIHDTSGAIPFNLIGTTGTDSTGAISFMAEAGHTYAIGVATIATSYASFVAFGELSLMIERLGDHSTPASARPLEGSSLRFSVQMPANASAEALQWQVWTAPEESEQTIDEYILYGEAQSSPWLLRTSIYDQDPENVPISRQTPIATTGEMVYSTHLDFQARPGQKFWFATHIATADNSYGTPPPRLAYFIIERQNPTPVEAALSSPPVITLPVNTSLPALELPHSGQAFGAPRTYELDLLAVGDQYYLWRAPHDGFLRTVSQGVSLTMSQMDDLGNPLQGYDQSYLGGVFRVRGGSDILIKVTPWSNWTLLSSFSLFMGPSGQTPQASTPVSAVDLGSGPLASAVLGGTSENVHMVSWMANESGYVSVEAHLRNVYPVRYFGSQMRIEAAVRPAANVNVINPNLDWQGILETGSLQVTAGQTYLFRLAGRLYYDDSYSWIGDTLAGVRLRLRSIPIVRFTNDAIPGATDLGRSKYASSWFGPDMDFQHTQYSPIEFRRIATIRSEEPSLAYPGGPQFTRTLWARWTAPYTGSWELSISSQSLRENVLVFLNQQSGNSVHFHSATTPPSRTDQYSRPYYQLNVRQGDEFLIGYAGDSGLSFYLAPLSTPYQGWAAEAGLSQVDPLTQDASGQSLWAKYTFGLRDDLTVSERGSAPSFSPEVSGFGATAQRRLRFRLGPELRYARLQPHDAFCLSVSTDMVTPLTNPPFTTAISEGDGWFHYDIPASFSRLFIHLDPRTQP